MRIKLFLVLIIFLNIPLASIARPLDALDFSFNGFYIVENGVDAFISSLRGGVIKASVSINNTSSENGCSVWLILAAYSGEKALLGLKTAKIDIDEGEKISDAHVFIDTAVDINALDISDCSLKFMVWDGYSDIIPLFTPRELDSDTYAPEYAKIDFREDNIEIDGFLVGNDIKLKLDDENPTNLEYYSENYNIGGQACQMTYGANGSAGHLYFAVSRDYMDLGDGGAVLRITYFDNTDTPVLLQYVSTDISLADYKYKPILIPRKNTNTWKTAYISLNDAMFIKFQNKNTDFRIYSQGGVIPCYIKDVSVIKNNSKRATAVVDLGDTAYNGYIDGVNMRLFAPVTDGEQFSTVSVKNDVICRMVKIDGRYLCFKIDDSYAAVSDRHYVIKVTYWDNKSTANFLRLQYNDGSAWRHPYFGTGVNSENWKTIYIYINDLKPSAANGYDFRLGVTPPSSANELYVSKVEVLKLP